MFGCEEKGRKRCQKQSKRLASRRRFVSSPLQNGRKKLAQRRKGRWNIPRMQTHGWKMCIRDRTTLDPHYNVDNSRVLPQFYSGLLRLNADGDYELDIATGYERSDDGMTWTFTCLLYTSRCV